MGRGGVVGTKKRVGELGRRLRGDILFECLNIWGIREVHTRKETLLVEL